MQGSSHAGSGQFVATRAVRRALAATLVLACVCGCKKAPERAPQDEVTALLRQEAEAIKATGEKLDPVLRVNATWTLAELAAKERPGDADRPWSGVIRFHIRAETKDVDGRVQVDELDKRFDYLWSQSLRRWLIQPAAP